jgi:hypothetical protein
MILQECVLLYSVEGSLLGRHKPGDATSLGTKLLTWFGDGTFAAAADHDNNVCMGAVTLFTGNNPMSC